MALSSFSSSTPSMEYDVFLSFRGEDTRNCFTSHLYSALRGKGIAIFNDDEVLERGEQISSELFQAIHHSRIAIVVFTENYASSSWCLDELVSILECGMKPGKYIIPIFYTVDPGVVRHQSGTYATAFAEHEKNYPQDKIDKWRFGLSRVANFSGWHLDHGCRSEVELIQNIVQDVSLKLTGSFERFPGDMRNPTDFSSDDDELVDDVDVFKYDVFLSFNIDEATVMGFTYDLVTALSRKGIFYTMNDDHEEYNKQDDISPDLPQAIRDSKFFIIVLSKNYAASSWCLDELVHILECKRTSATRKVIPIFYNVDSFMVRHQTNGYENAFAAHEQDFRHHLERVKRWRSALAEVGSLSGWDLNNGHEQDFITDIVHQVTRQLNKRVKRNYEFQQLIGIDSQVKKLFSLLETSVEDVRIIGIWGISGIGNSTIASAIYDMTYDEYEVCCYLASVRKYSHRKQSLVTLQQQLLGSVLMLENIIINDLQHGIEQIRQHFCNKRCLVVLDDVDELEQLDALAGEADWFGVGSRIIIMTTDAHLLNSKGVDKIYMREGLNPAEAMELLSLNSFRQKQPLDGYDMICEPFSEYPCGNPLAHKVLGSFLYGQSVAEWESSLCRVNENPERHMLNVLHSSFDSLDDELKDIFLDIACFFNGKKVDRVVEVLDCCSYYPKIGIAILVEKSLVTISDDILCMHHLLQKMGWEIVHEESPREPGKRSRLWHHEDINEVMTKNLGTEKIEAMVLDQPELECNWNYRAFERMRNLRLLNLHCKVHLPDGLEYLPNNLRFLKWRGYPWKYFPQYFYPSKLVELNMCHSRIELLWRGEKVFSNLKLIKLSHSQELKRTPNFTGFPNLERLVLVGCRNLVEVHPSIGNLAKLRLLNLKDCSSVRSLPDFISMESLEICVLSGCSSLENFPNVVGNMRNLSQFYMDGSVFRCLGDHSFNIRKWNNLECLLSNIPTVTKLCLRNCDLPEGEIPSAIKCLTSLEVLDVSRNKVISLPDSISQLAKLKFLGLAHCNLLQTMPELPSSIEYVEARDCSSLVTLSNAFKEISCTNLVLSFINCYKLKQNQDVNSLMVTLLKAYVQSLLKNQNQELSHLIGHFDIVIPGNIVPEWFRHQNMGPSVRIQLPKMWSTNNWIGFAFCVVFDVHENIPVVGDHDHLNSEKSQEITCQLYTNEGPISSGFGFNISRGSVIKSSHLWECYISNGSFRERMAMWNRTSYIEASFGTGSQSLDVKKCGFRVVYKQDVEETNNRKFKYIYPPTEDMGLGFFSFDT